MIMKNDNTRRNLLMLISFLLFVSAFVAILLELVGVKAPYLAWLDVFGRLPSFIIKLLMMAFGIALAFGANLRNEDSDEYIDKM